MVLGMCAADDLAIEVVEDRLEPALGVGLGAGDRLERHGLERRGERRDGRPAPHLAEQPPDRDPRHHPAPRVEAVRDRLDGVRAHPPGVDPVSNASSGPGTPGPPGSTSRPAWARSMSAWPIPAAWASGWTNSIARNHSPSRTRRRGEPEDAPAVAVRPRPRSGPGPCAAGGRAGGAAARGRRASAAGSGAPGSPRCRPSRSGCRRRGRPRCPRPVAHVARGDAAARARAAVHGHASVVRVAVRAGRPPRREPLQLRLHERVQVAVQHGARCSTSRAPVRRSLTIW